MGSFEGTLRKSKQMNEANFPPAGVIAAIDVRELGRLPSHRRSLHLTPQAWRAVSDACVPDTVQREAL
jgi:hypothetical protein